MRKQRMKLQWRLKPLSGALTLTLALATNKTFYFARSFCSGQPSSFALKNVTRSNFDSALADLRGLIRAADFVSIDLEMTGISSTPWRESLEFDRADVRYLKVKDSAEKFAVVQFGVCPFRWDQSKQGFIAHPHNFYVFPRQELPVDGPSYEFLCQTSSIDFLAKHQFDFNTCIHEGVSYISREQEAEALRRLNLAYKDELSETCCNFKDREDIPLVRMADDFFTERIKDRISEWHGGLQERSNIAKLQGFSNDLKQKFQTSFYKMRPALMLNGFTFHQMQLIQLVTKKHFEDITYVHVNGEDSCLQHLLVYTDSEDDRSILMKEVKDELHKEAEKKVKAAVGFRQVIDLLSSEHKLIVGHNCFLDIAQIYNKFLGPLPSTAEEFVSSVHKHFPCIIDTKVLLNADGVLRRLMQKNSTSLFKAFTLLCPQLSSSFENLSLGFRPSVKVEVQVDDMSSCKWNYGAKHEAGYDAFMTGCLFAQACTHLGIDFKLHLSSANLAHNEKLEKHVNLLYLSWNRGEIIDLRADSCSGESSGSNSLKKNYSRISFSNSILIWGFPPKFKVKEIRECISKVFGPSAVISIFLLDETALFVLLNKPELVSEFLILKKALEGRNDPISNLHPLSALFEGGNTHATSYEVYKEICSSPVSEVLFADQAEAAGIKWKANFLESKVELEIQEHGNSGKDGAFSVSNFSDECRTTKMEDVPDDPSVSFLI